MDHVSDLIKILLPAALVLYAMYLVMRSFLQKDFDKKLLDIKLKNADVVLPIRLQAYERMTLFLERISPNNMLLRMTEPELPTMVFQQQLLKEIRDEFHHNHSQQVYMSDEAWAKVRQAMNEIIGVIQKAGEKMKPESNAVDLSSAIFNEMMALEVDYIGDALRFLKNEIRQYF